MGDHADACACATCGDALTRVLDFAYQAPDCIWAQPASERSPRNNVDFAEMDGRYFVRCVLPISLKDGERFRYGVWLEVVPNVFDEVIRTWNDDARYPALRFTGRIANALSPWGSKALGVEVDASVREPTARPYIEAARAPWLQVILENGWTTKAYEAAIASFRR